MYVSHHWPVKSSSLAYDRLQNILRVVEVMVRDKTWKRLELDYQESCTWVKDSKLYALGIGINYLPVFPLQVNLLKTFVLNSCLIKHILKKKNYFGLVNVGLISCLVCLFVGGTDKYPCLWKFGFVWVKKHFVSSRSSHHFVTILYVLLSELAGFYSRFLRWPELMC